jgi:hypothetical protein
VDLRASLEKTEKLKFVLLVLMHLVLFVMFVAQISTSSSIPVHTRACFITTFIIDFLVVSRRVSLVSSD